MSEPLVFMMGEFEAEFPVDRWYVKNHMWAQPYPEESAEGRFRFGFSAYAVRLLQDVYFLDWSADAPAQLNVGQQIGSIESKKAESDLFAPAAGGLRQYNDELLDDPSAINVDKYGRGWLFEMQCEPSTVQEWRLTPEEYLEHLGDVWEITQKTIKGQING